jgi:hypothetical protein
MLSIKSQVQITGFMQNINLVVVSFKLLGGGFSWSSLLNDGGVI